MKFTQLSNLQTADLCRQLGLLLHAGVSLGDGLSLLRDGEENGPLKGLYAAMQEKLDGGAPLWQAFEEAGCFPLYVTGLVKTAEGTGRLEAALNSLADFYENKERTRRQIVNALTYPAILLALMAVVITVLLTRVLPVFNDVYASLGGQLTGLAGALLTLGQVLDGAMPILCGLLCAALVLLALFWLNGGFRRRLTGFWRRHWGDSGIPKALNNARFAQAMAMGFSGGLLPEDAAALAAKLLEDCPKAKTRGEGCIKQLQEGVPLPEALGKQGFLSPAACRMLTLGLRSGSGDGVMEDIARRMLEEAQQDIERSAAKVEPALVLVTSLLVGVILLAVMLPLMNIMSVIG